MTLRPQPRPARRAFPARPGRRARPAPRLSGRQRRTSRTRTSLGTALLRLCGGLLFLSILTVYFSPLRGAAGKVHAAVVDAAAAGRYFAVREVSLLRFSLRYGISLELVAAIEQAALAEGIDPDLALRLVKVESGFRERAVSPAGARGLTQLMPATAADLQPGITEESLFDRTTNLRLGLRYLRWLLDRYDGDLSEALHAYNRGPGTVARIRAAGGDPANGYAERVLRGTAARPPYRGDGRAPALPPSVLGF